MGRPSEQNEPEDLPVAIFTSTSFRVKSRDEISLSYPGPFHFSYYFIVPKVHGLINNKL
jgi:hypothetical protein